MAGAKVVPIAHADDKRQITAVKMQKENIYHPS